MYNFNIPVPLLQDMIKYSRKTGQSLNDLQMALDLMLKVLKNLNDSLHVVGLKGFPVSSIIVTLLHAHMHNVHVMLQCVMSLYVVS